jgi:hypothetical protein
LRRRGVVHRAHTRRPLESQRAHHLPRRRHLIASQFPIEGAAGIGYSLRKGYDLRPLMFTESELDALVFGARMVRTWGDAELGQAADAALAKIEGVLPHLQRNDRGSITVGAGGPARLPIAFDLVACAPRLALATSSDSAIATKGAQKLDARCARSRYGFIRRPGSPTPGANCVKTSASFDSIG